jgi:hypothetical protein
MTEPQLVLVKQLARHFETETLKLEHREIHASGKLHVFRQPHPAGVGISADG